MIDNLPDSILKYVQNKEFKINNIGFSNSTIYIFDNIVLKIDKNISNSKNMVKIMKWLKGKIPVPEVICHEIYNNNSYLLMSKINGLMSCDTYYLEHSELLLKLISKAFKILWSIDISDCPVVKDIDTKLKEARIRVKNNIINRNNFKNEKFKEPEDLLLWLENNKPEYEPVFSHGDFCLPNIILEGDDKISGFIDIGDAGISDKWYDITLCYISLKNNFNGSYGGKVYPKFDPNILFEVLEIEPNYKKIEYFTLLEELY